MGNKFTAITGADATLNSDFQVNSLVVTTTPARLYSITVYNNNAAIQYLQLFDQATVPDDGDIPKIILPMAGNETSSIDFTDGRIFRLGIYICNSTTDVTKTIGAADCIIDCTYRKT